MSAKIFDNYNLLKLVFTHHDWPMRLKLKEYMPNKFLMQIILKLDSINKTSSISYKLDNATNSCIISLPNGNLVTTCGFRLRFIDTANYTVIHVITASERIDCLLSLPNGDIATGVGNTITIWDVSKYNKNYVLQGHQYVVQCLSLMNKDVLISGSVDCTIRLWDLNEYKCTKVLEGHTSLVTCLLVLPGRFVSGSNDLTIRLWNGNKCLDIIKGHKGAINCLILLDDGNIASGSKDKTIKIWDGKSFSCQLTILGHSSSVNYLLLKDGLIISASGDKTIKTWILMKNSLEDITPKKSSLFSKLLSVFKKPEKKEYKCLKTLSVDNHIYFLASLPDERMATGSYNAINIWGV
jgi:WD40 repeat protein